MHFAWCKLAVGKLPVLLVVWSLWPTGIKLVDVTIMRIKNFVITVSFIFFSNSVTYFNCVLFGYMYCCFSMT